MRAEGGGVYQLRGVSGRMGAQFITTTLDPDGYLRNWVAHCVSTNDCFQLLLGKNDKELTLKMSRQRKAENEKRINPNV